MPRAWGAAATLAVLLLCAGACGGGQRAVRDTRPITLPLSALDGGTIDLAKYRDRIVVLHLFTTWSLSAQSDVIQLGDAHRAWKDSVTVVGVALDPAGYRVVAAWRSATRVPYLVATPRTGVREGQSMLGRIRSEPTTVILARGGTIAERVDGPLRPGQLAKVLARLMGKR